ncbi:hypothetical protein P3T25_007215 [Paraburkholderia sp. GAS32]
MNGHTAMDDRFDRRELLLHLGDILEALHCLARTSRPDAPVAQLAQKENSLQDFAFLRALAPTMTVAEFSARAASAFFLWPKELLETELNRNALASTVQHDLFDGNAEGWSAYVAHIQKKVAWFGTGLLKVKRDQMAEPSDDTGSQATPPEVTGEVPRAARRDAPSEKKGWPWPGPESTS